MGIWKLKLENWPYEFETDLKLYSAHPRSMEIIPGGGWLRRTVVVAHEKDQDQNSSWSLIRGLRASSSPDRWSLKLREVRTSSRRSDAVVGWLETAWGSWVKGFVRGSSARSWRRSSPERVDGWLSFASAPWSTGGVAGGEGSGDAQWWGRGFREVREKKG